jgi:hypothetical protein
LESDVDSKDEYNSEKLRHSVVCILSSYLACGKIGYFLFTAKSDVQLEKLRGEIKAIEGTERGSKVATLLAKEQDCCHGNQRPL